MKSKLEKIIDEMKSKGISPEVIESAERELEHGDRHDAPPREKGIYEHNDFEMLPGYYSPQRDFMADLKTLEDLLDMDNQREKDGFPRRIRIGRLVKPEGGGKGQVIIVPTTTEPKFYHDDSITEDNEEESGGSGEGQEGEVIGEQEAQPQQGEGEGQGAGQGDESDHEISKKAFDLGRVLTEKFKLPNLKDKGSKKAFTKYKYDLTDRNRGFGQVLEKKQTLKKIIETNIQLGTIDPDNIDLTKLIVDPKDMIYRILSKEKDFESQAIVFFLRDYSGSMQGDPTEVVTRQHLFIYSWLMFQYQSRVLTRFIVHDTEAKEVEDFAEYYQSQVAGGTKIAPAFELVNKIVREENLASQYNIYVFHGTDGDDWDETGREMLKNLEEMFDYVNRIGVTVAKNSWSQGRDTTVEKYLNKSGVLKNKSELIKLDAMTAADANESRIVEGIKTLVE